MTAKSSAFPTSSAKDIHADAEQLRLRLDLGSLNLRGVAAALDLFAEDIDGTNYEAINIKLYLPQLAMILRLLSRDVDREADTMGDAEAFLLPQTRAA